MGKRLIQQARGKGSPTYRAPSFRYKGKAAHKQLTSEIVQGIVVDLVKCPGHTAPLAAVKFADGEMSLILAPEGIYVGQIITSGPTGEVVPGNTLTLENIPEGTLIFNIEKNPGDGGKFCRAGGTFAKIVSKSSGMVTIQLPSKKNKIFNSKCRAGVGIIAGSGRKDKPFLKAGAVHHRKKATNKIYPHVSGVSMNAVDHPFGGSSSHHKGKPTLVPRNAPPGRKVGQLRSRRTGRKKR